MQNHHRENYTEWDALIAVTTALMGGFSALVVVAVVLAIQISAEF